ncbi:rhox homeobox family member 1-like [Manis javanica]|uniref:rhox homeobox family member 1-like n=1 Tax=Manis javanica TaxID=9974 RepID=UPI003C6D37A5
MERQPRGNYHDLGIYYNLGYFCLGTYETGIRSGFVQGAASDEKGGGHPGEGTPDLTGDSNSEEGDIRCEDKNREGDGNHEGDGSHEVDGNHEGSGGGQKNQQPEDPACAAAAAEAALPHRGKRRARRIHFMPEQLRVMESIFEQTRYLDGLTRSLLARSIGETEARVQMWFKNRRAKYKRNQSS